MAWTTPRTWVAGEVLTAALLNAQLRDNFNELDVAKITGYGDYIVSTGANALAARQYGYQRIDTSQGTTSFSYVDLATVGPQVTLTTGTSALLFYSARIDNAGGTGSIGKISYAVSGATTIAVSDDWMACRDGLPATNAVTVGQCHVATGLTAGSNTFTMKYAGDGTNTATFDFRQLTVLPL
jgi:hypothetical protein